MDAHAATEAAYKNGYEKGYAVGKAEVARGIFEEIEQLRLEFLTEKITGADLVVKLFLLKKKYTEGGQ